MPRFTGSIIISPVTRASITAAHDATADAARAERAVARVDTAETPKVNPAAVAPAVTAPVPVAPSPPPVPRDAHGCLIWRPTPKPPRAARPAPAPAPSLAPAAPWMGLGGRPGAAYAGLTSNPWAQSALIGRLDQDSVHRVTGDRAAREARIRDGATFGALPDEQGAPEACALVLLVRYEDGRTAEARAGEGDCTYAVRELLDNAVVRSVECSAGGFFQHPEKGWIWKKKATLRVLSRGDVAAAYKAPKPDVYQRPSTTVRKRANYNRSPEHWGRAHNDRVMFSAG